MDEKKTTVIEIEIKAGVCYDEIRPLIKIKFG